MYFLALATDYDGTLATDGRVGPEVIDALRSLKSSGRKLVMVTGREREDLERVFPDTALFDLIVAENGALLIDPATGEETLLTTPPEQAFVERLRERQVARLSVGRCIVATWQPHEAEVLEAIRDLGLELQITFNKGAVMVLPAGVTKASGLEAALRRLGLSPHNVVGIGDAENDHAFLRACGCSVAVANALPAVKQTADIVTEGARGAGVSEVVDQILADDLASVERLWERHLLPLGRTEDGRELNASPWSCTLVAGVSGGGKSTLITGMLESLATRGFQYCVIDPEGDYEELAEAVQLGDPKSAPRVSELDDILATPDRDLVFSLLALDAADRPGFLAALLPRLAVLRAQTGRPHWLIVDEAHHMLPTHWKPAPVTLPEGLRATVFVTVHPNELAPPVLARITTVVAVGGDPGGTLANFARATGREPPVELAKDSLGSDEAIVWHVDSEPVRIKKVRPTQRRRRHLRKYSEGELSPDHSFYFRGPNGVLNLRAHNLSLFLQLADGVDDDTWLHHLRAREYSAWLRMAIKDDALADEVARIEHERSADARSSRDAIAEQIRSRYIAPASAASGSA
jgi:HAD superfamily hydrolase (TIGR01484 family)